MVDAPGEDMKRVCKQTFLETCFPPCQEGVQPLHVVRFAGVLRNRDLFVYLWYILGKLKRCARFLLWFLSIRASGMPHVRAGLP